MIEYIKFWLAQYLLGIIISLVLMAGFFVFALWSMHGQRFYKETKEEKRKRKESRYWQ